MSEKRNNHYVPQWYQRGFFSEKANDLRYLDLSPKTIVLPNGKTKKIDELKWRPTSFCFYEKDLYTTFFGHHINVEIETYLFGNLDTSGSKAVKAFIGNDVSEWHRNCINFFEYVDVQKIRTPKGLNWLRQQYGELEQNSLMLEMQAIQNMNCALWSEGVREIVSAKNSEVKFIVSDHPVTVYNPAYSPQSYECLYPNDPAVALKGTRTIFPLDMDHCLIFTNYEYAQNPDNQHPTEKRTNARNFRDTMIRTDAFIKSRNLNEEEVTQINFILKSRARRFLAAGKEEWLYPEQKINLEWADLSKVLLPPQNGLWQFGGEMYVGYKDGSTHYQDAFGRTQPENKHLKKPKRDKPLKPNAPCGCGGAKKYKKCCMNKPLTERPSWEELSIRERNLFFFNGINKILGFSNGRTWDDVRTDLNDNQVKKIHELYGFLWPLETDLISLLPKPDKTFRALYTGIVHPQNIALVISLTPYFDEVIIQNPLLNPWIVSKEYSPLIHPHQHKLQTLKNLALFLNLMPYIDAGYINFIPDPCAFDAHLRRQMFSMADSRTKNSSITPKDEAITKQLHEADMERSLWSVSDDRKRKMLRDSHPNISDEDVEKTIEFAKARRREDPLCLLQDDLIGEKGGQLTSVSMVPNFELSLFIAQATGSILITDSDYRWREIISAEANVGKFLANPWSGISSAINDNEYVLDLDSKRPYELRNSNKYVGFRNSVRDIYNQVSSGAETTTDTINRLKQNFHKSYPREGQGATETNTESIKVQFKSLIPNGGIIHNHADRLLVSTGTQKRARNVPMAIFIDT